MSHDSSMPSSELFTTLDPECNTISFNVERPQESFPPERNLSRHKKAQIHPTYSHVSGTSKRDQTRKLTPIKHVYHEALRETKHLKISLPNC